ncbi:MAG TPA: energy-coupling factor transporter transmembrane protein EcfT [Acholeplasmataceae bacterium]|nr:energy-coupling factor transporter transmembrane protein EcfT [Acholeplasmataceae bacterium]
MNSSNIVLGQYYNTDSWIHRLDPRTKIIGIITLIIGLFLLTDIYALLIAFGVVVALILSTKIPFSKFIRSLRMVTVLLFVTIIFQILFNQGNNYIPIDFSLNILNAGIIIVVFILYFLSKHIITKFRFLLFVLVFVFSFYIQTVALPSKVLATYTLKFYEQGLITSVVVILRIVTLIFLSSVLTLTTKPTDLNNGLEKLASPLKKIGVKVSILTMMISIALRFIPTLINEANKILKAQASRGVDFKEGKLREKINQIISLLIPMFVISYKRAYDLADAMEARGYIPEAERTSINMLKFRFRDFVAFFFAFLLLATSIYYKVVIV